MYHSQNPGACGKGLQRFLGPGLWNLLVQSYGDGSHEGVWNALLACGELFRSVANPVAKHFGFAYPHNDDARVTAHLHAVRALPPGATKL